MTVVVVVLGAVNYWSKRLSRDQDPFCGRREGLRRRETEAWKIVSAIWGPRGSRERRKGGNSGRQKGPIGGQSLRVRGSIWKATLCLALYCTPCCFNQWQACSQSLEQQWLLPIVSLQTQTFPAPLHSSTSHQISEERRNTSGVSVEIFALCRKAKKPNKKQSVYSVMMI